MSSPPSDPLVKTPVVSIVLAAGQGTRMRSDEPKCAHRVAGVPMVELVAEALRAGSHGEVVAVVGHGADRIREILSDSVRYAEQRERLGTGHAVLAARETLDGFDGDVIVAAGDTPLVTAETVASLLARHRAEDADVTLASALLDDPAGYGRIVRNEDGAAEAIREEKDASDAERGIREVNAGLYVFRTAALWSALAGLRPNNAQGEYYLTDAIEAIVSVGGKAIAVVGDADVLLGVNDRAQLAAAGTILRERTLARAMDAGAWIADPATTFLSPLATFGPECRIEPGSHVLGRSRVGAGARVGPNSVIKDSTIGPAAVVLMSHVDGASVGEGAVIGPFANIRPGTRLGAGVRIGNFVEVKNAILDDGAKANHLAYLGDAEIGAGTNVGAGTITCNYDGHRKHRTLIGADAFVGSNSTLVAPIEIGAGAMVAAGSVVTKDVPAGAAAFGRARQETREGWVQAWRRRRGEASSS